MKGQRRVTSSEEYIKQKDIKQKMQQWRGKKEKNLEKNLLPSDELEKTLCL